MPFDDRSTVATWLHDAGYRTAMLGKYLNGYEGSYVPPGWDRWFATYDDGGYYQYRATDDGVMKRYGSGQLSYGTSVLVGEAERFIGSTPTDTPLFLYFAHHAPHAPAIAAPGDGDAFSDLPAWRPSAYDELDVSDKPEYIRGRARLDDGTVGRIDAFHRMQYQSLLGVDQAVGTIVEVLAETGRLGNTLIAFTSDNGMLWGEHRWHTKLAPYEESIRVPFVLRYDAAIRSPRTDEHFVLNIDLAPTIAAAAGVGAPDVDGADLAPISAIPPRRATSGSEFVARNSSHVAHRRGDGVAVLRSPRWRCLQKLHDSEPAHDEWSRDSGTKLVRTNRQTCLDDRPAMIAPRSVFSVGVPPHAMVQVLPRTRCSRATRC